MSASSSQCAARPVVPPKPEKDKISSPILGGSSPTSSATASAVSSPEGIGSRSSPRQTVGTQVNFMLRKPSSSSVAASPSSSSASRFPSDGPSTTTTENSESTTTKTSKVNITSPKPALPPKPSASAFKKGSTSPQIQKFNSSTSTSTTTNTDQLISSSVSPVHNNHQNNNDSQTDNQNQKIEQDQRIIRNVQLKTVNGSVEVGTAPVAHIEELDNLSDLNSPSPVRHKEISSPPSSQHHHHPPMKDIVSALNTKFGNFDGGRVNAPPAVVNKKPYKPPIPPPPFLHHAPTSGVPKNFLHSNIPPPVSPRRAHHTAPTTTTTDINRFPSVGVGRGQVFQFPPNNSIPTNNNNINSSHTSFFTPQQIQQRQAKSASLGRTAPTSFTSNLKKSTTLSRVAPLDLISTTVKGPSISTVHTAPVLGLSSNKKPGSLPLTPAFHFRPVASSSDKCSSVPPPPPPRMRRSQRGLSLTAGQQNIIDGKSPTSPTSPTSPGFDSMGIPDKPVYATVDKEKKWAARLQKQNSEGSHQHQNEISSAENEIETTVKKSSSDNEESACESIVNSSLTITTSWLGRKFIDSGAVSETTTTTTMTENSTSGGGVISSGSFNNQVDSVSSIEAARNGVTHEAVHINNINFSNDNNMHSNIYNSTVQQHQHRQQQQQQQPHHLIYNSPSNNNIDSDKTTPQHSVASSSMNNNNENFNTRDEEGEVVVVEQMITNNNNNKQKQPTTEKNEQKENMNDSPSSLVQPQVQSEKDGLCRNKSFLYAMQDTNLKLDQLDRVQEEVVPYNEIDNIALKEINLSSTAATVDGGSGDKDNNTHPAAAAAAIITKTTTTTAPHHHHHVAECEVEEINQNPFWDISSRSISGNSNNSKLTSNSNSNLAQQDHTNNTTAREAASNEKNSQQQQHPPPPHENKSMDTIKVSVIPNRESVLDVFERELEIQLESLESFCASQTVDPLSPSSVSANFNDDGQSQVSTSSRSSSMAAAAAAAVSQKPDPSKFLELVDSRLQSMQNLLENIATSPTRRGFPSSGSDNNNSVPSNSQSFEEGRCVPLGFEIPGMGEYMEMESGETGSSQSSTRRLTDGDIVTDIVLSSKRFEGSGLVLSSRRSVTGSTEPDVNGRGGTTTAAEEETSAVNIVVECGQNEEEGTSVDIDLPQLKANSGSNNNSNLDTGTDVDGTSPFQRRSWNLSDYSPSPSDSSSTSSGRSRPNNHQRRSCDFSAADSTPGGGGSHGRRKQVSSSWIDIGEDELSGALGDAESSDALVPSSTEDIERSHGHPVEKVTRRKRGIVSLFGSFGKSGSSSSHSPQFPTQNRSQFFLDDSPSNLESTESHHHHPHHPPERRDHRDKTRSLPAGSPVNVFDVPRRPHRALQRTSPSSAGAQLTMSFDEASQMRSNNDNSEQNSSATSAVAAVAKSATVMMGAASAITTILGDSENSSSARSSICYDEVLADLSTKQRKAFFVARELLTSERSFVDVLNLLTVDFPLALKLTSDTIRMPVIGSSDLDFILGGLPTLKAVNEVLMNELEERIAGWKENPKIADIIVKTGPFLKHYSTYVRDFERIVQRLDHCCAKYPSFARALREFEANDRCQKLGLKHYMLKPVQRMPQYRLLLEDYLKTLDETCEDYNDTVKAIAIVKEVAEHANEAINLQINAEKLMTLQNRLPNIIVLRTNRFLLKEGELLKVCRKELQPRYFALMTDVLLCMTYNASSGSNMKDLKLRYDLPLAGMRCSSKFEDYANEFSVISTTRSFSLVAKSARERDEWMKALSLAIQDNIKKRACTTPDFEKEFRIGAEAPVWIQDKRVSMCQVCTAEFTVTFRRHHCRACGKCVCGNCSGNQAPLQYLDNAAARVCEGCYQHLLEEFDRENCEKNTDAINEIRGRFRKLAINSSRANRQRKSIPDKFKIPEAINSESRISGYLQCREKKSWKRHWFVLMDRVLYVYAASEDIVAMRTLPVLGYQIEPVSEEVYPGVDPQLMFRLTHSGVSNPLVFMAENYSAAEKWMTALQEATVLT